MKSTNAQDRVRMYDIMDKFCAPPKPMLYEPITDMEKIDALLWSEKRPLEKMFGVAKIVSQPGNFGSKPSIPAPKELVDFLYELATLCSVKSAIIFKFRDNKLLYWRIEDPYSLPFENAMRRGKSYTTYQVPIQNLRNL